MTARTPIARIGTETLSPMDALADRREAEPLTHRQTLLIVLGVLLPTFMGSLDQTILATGERSTISIVQQPVLAAAFAAFGP